jgi:hypothetical protein
MNNLINALWSRDLSTLWHGMGRTIAPMILKEKRNAIINFFAIFFMATLPFVILLSSYTITISFYDNIISSNNEFYYYCGILLLNLIIFFMAIIGITLKSIEMYKISPLYALFYPIGSLFLVIAYLSNIIPLLLLLSISNILQKKQYNGKEESIPIKK